MTLEKRPEPRNALGFEFGKGLAVLAAVGAAVGGAMGVAALGLRALGL